LTNSNRLGDWLRAFRQAESDMTQEALAQDLGLSGAAYLSKVERGAIKKPNRTFLERLAKRSNHDIESLYALIDQSTPPAVQAGPGTLKLLTGFTIWSAPLALAAAEGWLSEVEVGMWANAHGDPLAQPSFGDMEWIHPNVPPADAPGLANTRVIPLTALDAKRFLFNETADIAALPGNLVPDVGSGIQRVGRLMDGAGGAVLLAAPELHRLIERECPQIRREVLLQRRRLGVNSSSVPVSLGTRDLAAVLPGLMEDPGSCIALEPGTIAERFFNQACAIAAGGAEKKREEFRRLAWARPTRLLGLLPYSAAAPRSGKTPDESTGYLIGDCEDAGKTLAGIITWEPFSSFVRQSAGGKLYPYYLHFVPDLDGRPVHLTFDLVILQKNLHSSRFRRVLPQLMQQLVKATQLLAEAQTNQSSEALTVVARHYGYVRAFGNHDGLREAQLALKAARFNAYAEPGGVLAPLLS